MPEYNTDTLDLTALPFWQWEPVEPPLQEVDTGIPFDSIHPLRELPDTVYRQSMFQSHTLQPSHTTLIQRENPSAPTWIFGVLLLLVGLMCLYYRLRKITVASLLKATMDVRAMDRLIRDGNLNRNILLLPMGILVVSVVCLPIQSMALAKTGFLGYLLLTIAMMLLYILRNRLLRLLGNTFEDKQAVDLYITSNYVYHLVEATVVIAMLFPFYYLPMAEQTMLYIIATFLAIAFLLRFLRGAKVFLTIPNSSSFYLFYYLCTVEMIPVLVVTKWFIGQ